MTVWKDIPGYKGLYRVSNMGNVKALFKCGKWLPGRILTPINHCGYNNYRLYKDGKSIWWKAHRLVLISFVRNPKKNEECRHLNGVRNDNRLFNLRWGTGSQNIHDAIKHGTWHQGITNGYKTGHKFLGNQYTGRL